MDLLFFNYRKDTSLSFAGCNWNILNNPLYEKMIDTTALGNLLGNKTQPEKVIEDMLKPEFINMKTDLSMSQIRALQKADWFIETFTSYNDEMGIIENKKNPILRLKKNLDMFKELMVSYNRLSRIESIDGIKSMPHPVVTDTGKVTGNK